MNRNTELALYLAKVEVTEGVDPTPTPTADAIELSEHFEPDDDFAFKPEAESRVRGPELHPGDPMSVAGPMIGHTRKAFLRGNTAFPTAIAPIELHPWFIGSGHAATYDATGAAEKVTYTPASTGLGSFTEWFYRDGILYKYTGVRCGFQLGFEAGGPCVITAPVSGRVASVADAAVPTNAVFRTTEFPLATDATVFTIDGFTAGIIRNWEHDLGNVVARRDGVKAVGGIQGWRIGRRNPTFKITLEEPTLAVKDFRTLRANKTPIAITWRLGGTTYQRIDFTGARAFIRKITPSNSDNLALITLEGVLRGTTPYSLAIM